MVGHPRFISSSKATSTYHPPQNGLKNPAVVVVVDFDRGIESGDNVEFFSAVITLDSVTLSPSKGAVQSSSDNQGCRPPASAGCGSILFTN